MLYYEGGGGEGSPDLPLPYSQIQKPMRYPKNDICFPLLFCLISYITSGTAEAQIQIQGNLHIASTGAMQIAYKDTYLKGAHITTDRSDRYGMLCFAPDCKVYAADHDSYVDGIVRMHGATDNQYVTGHDGVFQPARLINHNNPGPVDLAFAYLAPSETEHENAIGAVSDRYYWTVYHGTAEADVSLSWNVFSDLGSMVGDNLENLTIAGFDGTQWTVIESKVDAAHFYDGSSSSLLHGSVSSVNPVNLGGYTHLTLAVTAKGALNVSQGFTPNGDGINDTWFIEDIGNHPNAEITVFNRWQQIVFSHTGIYNNDWNGQYNGGPLPDASYFYTIDRDGDGTIDQSGWVYITH